MKPIISIIVTIAVVVGIITLMNLGLHYGQDLWHKEDNERLDVLKEEIQSLRARMDALHGVIEIVESPSQSDVDRYNEMVADCNEKIDEANSLAEKVGTKYRLRVGGRGRR
jgi:hypothetical protein